MNHAARSAPAPRVSICVPNLNTRPYLEERFQTIFDQSFRDWELLVYDSYSDDGAWEYIAGLATREPRMHAWQGPRAGTPGSWTPCIRAARGAYVYIATSDDTMPPECLDRLVAALDAHPECDLAHCALRPIDERGRHLDDVASWWSQAAFARSSGDLVGRPHVRLAPFDGLLHLLGGSVYVSVTQLLIRRSLFDRIGYFRPTWGSIGDFNWAMRAGLVASTVHVPGTWGGWRVHSRQATSGVDLTSAAHGRAMDGMIEDAVWACADLLPARIREPLTSRWLPESSHIRTFTLDTARRRHLSFPYRAGRIAGRLCSGSLGAREYVLARLLGRHPVDWVRRRLNGIGHPACLIEETSGAHAPAALRRGTHVTGMVDTL